MRVRILSVLFSSVLFTHSLAQDILFQTSVDIDPFQMAQLKSHTVMNPNGEDFGLFLLANDEIRAYQFNKKFNQFLTIKAPEPPYRNLIGDLVQEKKYTLFFANGTASQFESLTIDFENNTTTNNELTLDLRGETFLQSFSSGNTFYILSLKKRSSVLHLHVFRNHAEFETKEFDFSAQKFSTNEFFRLSDVLKDVQVVRADKPNSLETAVKKFKVYFDESAIYMTLDNSDTFTKVIKINLENFTSSLNSYFKQPGECGQLYVKSNSFLYRNFLFMVSGCSKEMHVGSINLDNGTTMLDFKITPDAPIAYRNSPLIQEGGSNFVSDDAKRELDKNKQLLRKMADDEVGVAVCNFSGNLEVKIGGARTKHEYIKEGGGTMGLSPILYPLLTSYSFTSAFNSYAASKAVYFKSLLNPETLAHIEGPAGDNPFDKMRSFVLGLEGDVVAKTLFKTDEYFVLGYYLSNESKYYFRKFN